MIKSSVPEEIAVLLRQDKVCAIPTETVYGLAGNGLKPEVISRIFEIKNRPHFDPLILHVSGRAALEGLVGEIPEVLEKLMQVFWPGPLTVLLPKTDKVPDIVCSGSPFAGFRVPDHALTLALLRQLDFPLAAPSANPFGYISPTRVSHVLDQLGTRIDGILDGGNCAVGIESTVIGAGEGCIEIYRAGAITGEELEKVGGLPVRYKSGSEHPTAPGMLESHYAPRKVFLLETTESSSSERTAWLRFSTYKEGVSKEQQFLLADSGQLRTAAQNLFALMRELDQDERFDRIIAELVPEEGLGVAVNDKLRKAAFISR